ncbi:hypothetical protein FQN49_001929 [Arthroderma sp. PD_2]|nr:hypothetical protein FQN49_001929 [Arthroderma sp. PD_2]
MAASNNTFPRILEADLVFPRNDTYAPIPYMPFVLAIQNFHTTKSFYRMLKYNFSTASDPEHPIVSDSISFHNYLYGSFDRGDTKFISDFTTALNNTEGNWLFSWEWTISNCSKSTKYSDNPISKELNFVDTNFTSQRSQVYFNTKNGFQEADFLAATQDGTCNDGTGSGLAFNITGNEDNVAGGQYYFDSPECPIISGTTQTPNPCEVKIDDETAADILFSIQSGACLQHNDTSVCPPVRGGKKENAARRAAQFSVGGLVLGATLGWLVYIL